MLNVRDPNMVRKQPMHVVANAETTSGPHEELPHGGGRRGGRRGGRHHVVKGSVGRLPHVAR